MSERMTRAAREAMKAAALVSALHGAPQPADARDAAQGSSWQMRVEATKQPETLALPAFARTYGDAIPPSDFPNFCVAFPEECVRSPGSETRRMQRREFDAIELDAVNGKINALPQVSDQEMHGVPEKWKVAGAKGGDCEDLVNRKRYELIAKGWEPKDLLLTHVLDETGEGHLVLMVRTRSGDYILDNRRDIALWRVFATEHKYTFLSRQSYLDPNIWVSLVPPLKGK